jgi:hypothetical protein
MLSSYSSTSFSHCSSPYSALERTSRYLEGGE